MTTQTTTIAAIATPPGRGGIGIIRISGPEVLKITSELIGDVPKPRFAVHTIFNDSKGSAIDDGLAIYFKAPYSFTGEDVLELHGHGGQVVLDALLKRIIELGAVLARPGEFSERAFLNGKIDLAQAEAIADLIDASSVQAARGAVRSLQGEFSKLISTLKEKIIHLRVMIEALIDFSEEELNLDHSQRLEFTFRDIFDLLREIQQGAKQGELLRDGISVVIAGKPNVGKSSLLNCLTGMDTAIVTNIPGTTRDVIRSQIQIDGLPIHIIDTAGLQETTDVVEQEGIERAHREIEMADHILCVVDAAFDKNRNPEVALRELGIDPQHKNITILYNKIDLTGDLPKVHSIDGIASVYLSLKNSLGLDLLREHLKSSIGFTIQAGEMVFSARRRHITALEKVNEQLYAAKQRFLNRGPIELIAEDLHLAQKNLGEITGDFTSEDLLNRIFSEFCIGK